MKKILIIVSLIFILINSYFVFAKEYHGESPATPIPPPLPPPAFPQWKMRLSWAVNVYSNLQISTRGSQLANGDNVCVGDTISIKHNLNGEYFGKGGGWDSPPIQWGTHQLRYTKLCPLAYSGVSQRCYNTGVLCSENCKYSGNLVNNIQITQEGKYEFVIDCPVSCTLFVDLTSYQMNFPVKETFTINAVKPGSGPKLQVVQVFPPSSSSEGENNVRFIVQNYGDTTAILQGASLNVPSKVVYIPKSLEAGKTAEIIIQTSDTDNLKLSLNYKSAKLGCPPIDVPSTFDIPTVKPGCNTDANCGSGFICCLHQCRDPQVGVCRDINGDGILDWVTFG